MLVAQANGGDRAKHAFVRGRSLSLGGADSPKWYETATDVVGGLLRSTFGPAEPRDPVIIEPSSAPVLAMGAVAAVLAGGVIYMATR